MFAARNVEILSALVIVAVVCAGAFPLGEAAVRGAQSLSPTGNALATLIPIILALQAMCIVALLIQRRRQRLSDKALRENQANMNFAAKAAKLVLWSWDVRSSGVWLSELDCPVFGPMSSGSRLQDCLDVIHAGDRAEFAKQIENAVEHASGVDVEYRIVGGGEGVRWVKTIGHAEIDPSGSVVKLTGVTIDITERKEIELEAGEQREILTHASRVGVLGELSGAIAHELSQPLAAILSNAQAAHRLLARTPRNDGELREIVEDIISDNNRARDVITHLRTLLKKGKSKSELIDLNEEVRSALALAHSELIRRRVDVSLKLNDHLPPVLGDRIQLEQLLLNLILNAADAMSANQEHGELTITTGFDQAGSPQISVRDDGPGLSKEAMSRLFEPFYSTKAHGLGLGLAICNSIVTAHEGRLWAANNPDRGATFFVSFPSLARQAA